MFGVYTGPRKKVVMLFELDTGTLGLNEWSPDHVGPDEAHDYHWDLLRYFIKQTYTLAG